MINRHVVGTIKDGTSVAKVGPSTKLCANKRLTPRNASHEAILPHNRVKCVCSNGSVKLNANSTRMSMSLPRERRADEELRLFFVKAQNS